jgi:uncharacterized membrane protein
LAPLTLLFVLRSEPELETLVLRFNAYLPDPECIEGADITRAFRGIAAALRICGDHLPGRRLKCLEQALEEERQALLPNISAEAALERAGKASESLTKTVVAAQAVATVLATLGARLLGT